ncbi:MAG: hypothetical protein WC121_10315 [Candidatus Kapaibacterium sp.]
MKIYIAIFILLISNLLHSEEKDTRALLLIEGGVSEISVSPDEKIWLTTGDGNIYYTENIYSNWHYGDKLFESEGKYKGNDPHFDRITFFNNDTAIISGYISANAENYPMNGYYFSENSGIDWELKKYVGKSWVYTTYFDSSGNGWMGCSDKELYYSSDYGATWETKIIPFKDSEWILGIHMLDNKIGYISSEKNEVLYSEDNWRSVSYLPSPRKQDNIKLRELRSGEKPNDKIYKWKNFILINQRNNIFYSDLNNIDWKVFPINIIDFELDKNNDKFYAITDSLKVIEFESPIEYKYLSESKLKNYPIDLKVVNSSVFIIDYSYNIYKVNEKEFVGTLPYTIDEDIPKPNVIRDGEDITWGAIDNHLYLSNNGWCYDWYREDVLNLYIADIFLIDDSTAILWDGRGNNYIYSLKDNSIKPYIYENPLNGFLKYPVESLSILSGCLRCDLEKYEIMNFVATENDNLVSESYIKYDRIKPYFKSIIEVVELKELLKEINMYPNRVPTINEFNITEENKSEFINDIEGIISSEYWVRKEEGLSILLYYNIENNFRNVIENVETYDTNQIKKSLDLYYDRWVHYPSRFYFYFVNTNSDTLFFSQSSYASSPWYLPWDVKYKGKHFYSYNIEISKLINNVIPEEFNGKEAFDNIFLLTGLAGYKYRETNQPYSREWYEEMRILLRQH